MLRFTGHDPAECLAYAELFELAEGSFSIEPLFTPELNAETMATASAGAAPTGSAAL